MTTKEEREGIQIIIDHLERLDNSEMSGLAFDMGCALSSCECTDHPCGSAACIGGHASLLLDELDDGPTEALEKLCSIPWGDAQHLCWPGGGAGASYEKITLEQALDVLRHYRDTGEVDWTAAWEAQQLSQD